MKESDRIATVVDGLRGLGADIEATEDGFAVRGSGGLRAARSTPPATTASRCWARWPGWPRARGSRCSGWRPPRSPTADFVAGPARALLGLLIVRSGTSHADRDRRPRRRRQVDRRARARAAARLHLPRQRRDVSLRRACSRSSSRTRSPATLAASSRRDRARGRRGESDSPATRAARRARRERGDPHARGLRGGLARRRRPGVRAALVAKQRELIASGDWVAEGRDIGTVVAPDAELKVFLTADPGERARRRAAELGADAGDRAGRADAARRARPHA